MATFAGRLRPEVLGVDVDAGGALGDLLAELLRDWCTRRGLWHLLRPSGGGPGHWHLLVVPGVHRHALVDEISKIRTERRLTRAKGVEDRTVLRPLSAPHRTGRATGAPTAPDGLESALSALQAVLEPLPDRLLARRQRLDAASGPRDRALTAGGRAGPAAPLTPLRRPRRPLPAPWAAYLAHGRRAAAAAGIDHDPTTRSLLELHATRQLVITGHTEPQAWAAITAAHPTAFTKSRRNGRRWWWNLWNSAVAVADPWLRDRRAALTQANPSTAVDVGVDPGDVAAEPAPQPPQPVATAAARAALEAAWLTWPARTRHTDYEVLTVVLDRMDRMDRTGTTRVPIPQRDLVVDCAVASRTTIRSALDRLQRAGLLQVDPTYVPGTTDTSHTLRLPNHLTGHFTGHLRLVEQPSAQSDSGAVSLSDPPRVQPPQRRPPLHLRRALGLPAAQLLARMPDPDTPTGTALGDLALAAGLTDHHQPSDQLTARQRRTTRAHLLTLASHGLAHVDEHGHWRAAPDADPHADRSHLADQVGAGEHLPAQLPVHDVHAPAHVEQPGRALASDAGGVPGGSTPPAVRLVDLGRAMHDRVRDRVDHERTEFRARIQADARRTRWEQQRHGHLARAAKAARARQKGWWAALPPAVAAQRRAAASAVFAALTPAEQTDRKHHLAQRRARAGENEPARYTAWLTSLTRADLDQRSTQRALTFDRLPAHEQQQLVAGWTDHRTRWSLPHHQHHRAIAAAVSTVSTSPTTEATTTTTAAVTSGTGRQPRLPEDQLLHRSHPTAAELALLDDQLHVLVPAGEPAAAG